MPKTRKNASSRNKLLYAVVGVIAIVILIMFVSSFTSSSFTSTGRVTQSTCRDVQESYQDCGNVQVPYTEQQCNSVPYTDTQCDNTVLVYSITDFTFVSSICNNQNEVCHQSYPVIGCVDKTVYCTDRTVTCSLKVNNLDTARGSWTINFNFYQSGSNTIEATDSESIWLYPQTSGTVTGTGRITTTEFKNASYTCSYSMQNEPTKSVCHDVIKYRQECQDVTKYRTEYQCATNYRTVTKCD